MITPLRFTNDTLPKQDVDPEHFIGRESPKPKAAVYNNYRGLAVIGAHAPIPTMNWCLQAEIDEAEAFATVTRLTILMFSALLGLLLLGALICIRVSGTITNPIVRLHHGTEEIMKGNLDCKVSTRAKDEIGQLSRTFDKMTANLQESGRELEEYSRCLEKKVKARTARLEELLKESEQQRAAMINIAHDLKDTNIELSAEIGERKRTAEEVRKARAEADAVLEGMIDVVGVLDMEGRITRINKGVESWGYQKGELIGKPVAEFIAKRSLPKLTEEIGKTRAEGAIINLELVGLGRDGSEFPVLVNVTLTKDAKGEPTGRIFALRDITERVLAEKQIKAALKEKEVLLREIHHRVKNNLQIVSSLLDMQARGVRSKEVIDALTESKDRLNTMALIHAQLYESRDLAEINMKGFVSKLLSQLLRSYQVQGTEITPVVSVADYPVPISMAVPVGLIVNELLSNTLKHAFVGRKEGTINVSLTASEEGRINLTVQDDGVGLPAGFDISKTGTLGLRLIKILTEDQLHGTLKVIS